MRKLSPALAGCALAFGLLSAGALAAPAAAAPAGDLAFDDADAAPEAAEAAAAADEAPSEVVERFTRWVVAAGDHGGRPFAVVDKVRARVFVFDGDGRASGSAPVLIGSALGDGSAPGVGELELASIPAEDRTTPAGRFKSYIGPAEGENPEVLWVDYDTALSMHPVITSNRAQRRPHRLKTATPLDNRITFGCINVPADFYQDVVRPAFEGGESTVYILPETQDLEAVFPDFRWGRADRSVAALSEGRSDRRRDDRSESGATGLSRLLGF